MKRALLSTQHLILLLLSIFCISQSAETRAQNNNVKVQVEMIRDCSDGPQTLFAMHKASSGITYSVGTLGTIGSLSNIDEGFQWTCVNSQSSLLCITTSVDTIVAAGEAGALYYGTHENYTPWQTNISDTIHAITHTNFGWLFSTSGGQIYKAVRIGTPLQLMYSDTSIGSIRGLAANGDTVVAVTDQGNIVYTQDYGDTWSTYTVPDLGIILNAAHRSTEGVWRVVGTLAKMYTLTFKADTLSTSSVTVFPQSAFQEAIRDSTVNALLFLTEPTPGVVYTGGTGWRDNMFWPEVNSENVYSFISKSSTPSSFPLEQMYDSLTLINTDICIGVSTDITGSAFSVTSYNFEHTIQKINKKETLQEIRKYQKTNGTIVHSTVIDRDLVWRSDYKGCYEIGVDSILVICSYTLETFISDSVSSIDDVLLLYTRKNGQYQKEILSSLPKRSEYLDMLCNQLVVTAANGVVSTSSDIGKTWNTSVVASTQYPPVIMKISGSQIIIQLFETKENEPGVKYDVYYISTNCGSSWQPLTNPLLPDNTYMTFQGCNSLDSLGNFWIGATYIDSTKHFDEPGYRKNFQFETRGTTKLFPLESFSLTDSNTLFIKRIGTNTPKFITTLKDNSIYAQYYLHVVTKQDTGWNIIQPQTLHYSAGFVNITYDDKFSSVYEENGLLMLLEENYILISEDEGRVFTYYFLDKASSINHYYKSHKNMIASGRNGYLAQFSINSITSISDNLPQGFSSVQPTAFQNFVPVPLGKTATLSLYTVDGSLATTFQYSATTQLFLDVSNRVENGMYTYTIEVENTITKGIVNVINSTY